MAAMRGGAESANPFPMYAGLVALAASIVLAVVVLVTSSASVTGVMHLPLVIAERWWLSGLGWLTATATVVCAGLDRMWQSAAASKNPDFFGKPQFERILTIALWIALVLVVWHALNLAVPVSEMFS